MTSQTPLRSSDVLYLADQQKPPTDANDDEIDLADQHEAFVNRFETPVVATPRAMRKRLGYSPDAHGDSHRERSSFGGLLGRAFRQCCLCCGAWDTGAEAAGFRPLHDEIVGATPLKGDDYLSTLGGAKASPALCCCALLAAPRWLPLFSPHGPRKRMWDIAMLMIILYFAIATPLHLCFAMRRSGWWLTLEWAFTTAFFVDMLFTFNTIVYLPGGAVLTERVAIAGNYLRFWYACTRAEASACVFATAYIGSLVRTCAVRPAHTLTQVLRRPPRLAALRPRLRLR